MDQGMYYLLMQMIACLVAAGLLGLFLGWLLFGGRSSDDGRVKKLEADLLTARKDCDACVDARSDLEKQLTAALAERDTARVEAESVALTDATGSTSQLVELEDEIALLQGKLADVEGQASRIAELETALAAAATAGMGAAAMGVVGSGGDDDRLAALERDLADHTRRLSDVTLDRDNARARLAAQEARMLALKTDADGARADLADAERRLQAAKAQTGDADTAALHTRIAELEAALTLAPTNDEDEISSLRARIQELDAKLINAPTINEDPAPLHARISELEAALAAGAVGAAASDGGEDLKAQLSASEARYVALRERFEKSNLNYLKLLGERGPGDTRPAMLLDAPIGVADDLKKIKGIGPVLEGMLNGLGVYHFSQISQFTVEDIAWIVAKTEAFPDRIIRDRWVEQASVFLERLERGESI